MVRRGKYIFDTFRTVLSGGSDLCDHLKQNYGNGYGKREDFDSVRRPNVDDNMPMPYADADRSGGERIHPRRGRNATTVLFLLGNFDKFVKTHGRHLRR